MPLVHDVSEKVCLMSVGPLVVLVNRLQMSLLPFVSEVISLPPASAVEVIESVPSVCVSVSQHSHDWTVWSTDFKFGAEMHLDHISDEFDGQGHRSKFKVTRLKNVIFSQFYYPFLLYVTCYITVVFTMALWRHSMTSWRHGLTSWHHVTSQHRIMWCVCWSILPKGLCGKGTLQHS